MKVIGSGDKDFRTGHTDLRGVFEATGIRGVPTAIARKGDHYAFHRGTQPLLRPEPKKRPARPQPEAPSAAPAQQAELGNIKARLGAFQSKAGKVWHDQTRTEPGGVQVDKAF